MINVIFTTYEYLLRIQLKYPTSGGSLDVERYAEAIQSVRYDEDVFNKIKEEIQAQLGGGEGLTAPAPPAPPAPSPDVTNASPPDAIDVTNAVKSDAPKEPPANAESPQVDTVQTPPEPNSASEGSDRAPPPNAAGDWQTREQELLKKIEEMEKVQKLSGDGLQAQLKAREEEIDALKGRVKVLEIELQAALTRPAGKTADAIEGIKQQHEELLSKARGMIFEKTKMVTNQQLQIEALTTQVQSLKDINTITKDLLEIRNSEVKAMEDRLEAMDARWKAEKQRHTLVLERAQTSTNINQDLRKEYETQLAIFKELREKYDQRVQALVAENTRLKESLQAPSTT